MPAADPPPASSRRFEGFEYPNANFIYCPNQFFDVCLGNSSRGVVRLVAYILLRTLGWLDRNGEPVEQNIAVSFNQLIDEAGISRGAIRPAIDEAIDGGFVSCTEAGSSDSKSSPARNACYTLRWDNGDRYVCERGSFNGFFAGEGHRTPIPQSLFEHVIPDETLAVIKVVGTVLRHTIGYQNQFGHRRSEAQLSYSVIQQYANLRDRATLGSALHRAVDSGYIRCVEPGCFDADAELRRPATYAICWRPQTENPATGSKNQPAPADRFNNPTSSGSETQPAGRFKIPTNRKTKNKDTEKQQQQTADAASFANSIDLLTDAGFDDTVAGKLATEHPPQVIKNQVAWIDRRNASTNRLGLLRKAIEENWPKPEAQPDGRKSHKRSGDEEAADAALEAESRRRRIARLTAHRDRWNRLSDDDRRKICAAARRHAASESERRTLTAITDYGDISSGAFVILSRFLDSPEGESAL